VERASNRSLDEKRRQDEDDRRDLEYRRGVEERWRDERRAAHARLLALIGQVNDDASTYMFEYEDLSEEVEPPGHDELIPQAHRTELWEALGVVQLIASDGAVLAATKPVDSLEWVASMASTPWGSMKLIRKHWRDYEEALASYRREARQELGVAAPQKATPREEIPRTPTPSTSGG
jgi:hypothetical protein